MVHVGIRTTKQHTLNITCYRVLLSNFQHQFTAMKCRPANAELHSFMAAYTSGYCITSGAFYAVLTRVSAATECNAGRPARRWLLSLTLLRPATADGAFIACLREPEFDDGHHGFVAAAGAEFSITSGNERRSVIELHCGINRRAGRHNCLRRARV